MLLFCSGIVLGACMFAAGAIMNYAMSQTWRRTYEKSITELSATVINLYREHLALLENLKNDEGEEWKG